MRELSQAVKLALKNSSFRKLVKEQALIKFDGDYDVLFKHILKKTIVDERIGINKSGKEKITVEDLLEESFSANFKSKLKSSTSVIDQLATEYPNLQVSVPVHADSWDTETFTPDVAFIPENAVDGQIEGIPAYNQEGNEYMLDANNAPNEPVIVIGHNERIEKFPIEDDLLPPPAPLNLRGIETEEGIQLNWDMPSSATYMNTLGYKVYRKTSIETAYTLLGISNGFNNRSYNDVGNSIESGRTYSYYICAYNDVGNSLSSNYINYKAPMRPNPVASFSIDLNSSNEIELNWRNGDNDFITHTEVNKHVIGVTSDYTHWRNFSVDDVHAMDNDVIPGKKVKYQIRHVDAMGKSNAYYDFVNVPYRDVSIATPVYIKAINIATKDDLNEVEHWFRGAPEFYVAVAAVNIIGEPYMIEEQIICQYDKHRQYEEFSKHVLDWKPGMWYEMISFRLIEEDRGSDREFNFNIGYEQKRFNEENKNYQLVTGSTSMKYMAPKIHDYCGTAYLSYYDDPEKWMEFANYGISMKISITK